MYSHHGFNCLLLRGQSEANMARTRFDLGSGVALMLSVVMRETMLVHQVSYGIQFRRLDFNLTSLPPFSLPPLTLYSNNLQVGN